MFSGSYDQVRKHQRIHTSSRTLYLALCIGGGDAPCCKQCGSLSLSRRTSNTISFLATLLFSCCCMQRNFFQLVSKIPRRCRPQFWSQIDTTWQHGLFLCILHESMSGEGENIVVEFDDSLMQENRSCSWQSANIRSLWNSFSLPKLLS